MLTAMTQSVVARPAHTPSTFCTAVSPPAVMLYPAVLLHPAVLHPAVLLYCSLLYCCTAPCFLRLCCVARGYLVASWWRGGTGALWSC